MKCKILLIIIFFVSTNLVAQSADSLYIPAKIIKKVEAILPDSLQNLTDAYVSMKIEIKADSTVGDYEILFSSDKLIVNNAVVAVNSWIFQPSTLNGIPQLTEIIVNVQFADNNDSIFENVADSTEFILDSLQYFQRINKFVQENPIQKEKIKLPHSLFTEQYHFQTNKIEKFHTFVDGHILIPFEESEINALQNYFPYNDIDLRRNIFYTSTHSDFFMPAVTYTEIFMGDYDMNYALLNYRKGYLFNNPSLFTEVTFMGSDGYWMNDFEKNSTFKIMAGFHSENYKIIYQSYLFNHNYSSTKLYSDILYNISREDVVNQIQFLSNWINFSAKYSRLQANSSTQLRRDYAQFMISKKFETGFFHANTNLEYLEKSFLTSIKFSDNIADFYSTSIIFHNPDNFHFDATISYPISTTSVLGISYLEDRFSSERLLHIEKEANRFHKNEIFLNSSLKNFYTNITFAIETITDTIQTNEINIPVIENKIDYFTKIFDKDFELHNFTKIYLDLEEYSKISEQFETHFLDISSTLSIINKLKHNNSYGFEIENRFLGMDTEQYDEYIDIVNLKFILRITDKFELNIKMNNILSQQYLWGNEINLFHYQAGIKWIFLN